MDAFIELIRNINEYIILNEKRIMVYLDTLPDDLFRTDEGNKPIKFHIDDKSLKKHQNNKYLSIHNLQLLLNLGNKFLLNKILKNIENREFEYISNRKVYEIRKIRTSIKKWFSKSQEDLSNLLLLFNNAFQDIDTTIIDKILWVLDDFLDYTISATSLSKIMKEYKDYLTSSKNWFIPPSKTYFEFSSFFDFITHLLFIEYYIPSLKKKNLTGLKEEFLNLLFEHLIKLGIYDSETGNLFYSQFKAIAYTIFIHSAINIRKKLKSINATTIKNKKINLVEFSRHMKWGVNYFPGLFKKRSLMSKTTVINIQRDIRKNKRFCLAEYKNMMQVLEELNEISRSYIYRTAYVGILSHSVLEELVIRNLIEKNLEIEIESYINLPYSLHRADILIKNAINRFSLLDMDIVIDFTLTTENKYILDKLFRNYQKSNRKLLIVLYSENRIKKSIEIVDLLENLTFNHKDNVKVITFEEFCEYFDISINTKILLNLFNKAIKNDDILRELELRNTQCLKSLEQYISN